MCVPLFSFPFPFSCYTRRWVSLNALNWKLSGKKEIQKTCILFVSKRLKQIDSTQTHTHTHTGGFCCNHTHFFLLLDNYSLGNLQQGAGRKGALENVVGAVKTKTMWWWHWERTRKSMVVSCCSSLWEREENFLAVPSPTNQVLSVIPLHLCHVASALLMYKRSSRRARSWLKSRNVDWACLSSLW